MRAFNVICTHAQGSIIIENHILFRTEDVYIMVYEYFAWIEYKNISTRFLLGITVQFSVVVFFRLLAFDFVVVAILMRASKELHA